MKRKKLLSTAVAGALVAAQMVMPVAAVDGGSFNVGVTTRTPVLRVVVPTSMNIAVNQFEMDDAGSQIYSSVFEMENKSEVPVKLTVTSTATTPNTTKLVATKVAATGSTTEGEAWLAAAAQTSAGKYIEESGKGLNDLTEASPNVTTFTTADKKAEQTYYLNASSGMAYKLLNAGENPANINYAQFYELTAQTYANDDALKAAIKDGAVYCVATASIANGATLTKVADTDTWANTNTYYTPATAATAKDDIDTTANKLYVYGDGAVDADGKAAFRYIGKLSGKNETWSATDLSSVNVAYTIVGVQQTDYDALAAQPGTLAYGFYKAPAPVVTDAAPSVTTSTVNLVSGQATEITLNMGSGNKAATGIASITFPNASGTTNTVASAKYTYADGKITFAADWTTAQITAIGSGNTRTYTITFNDTDATTGTFTATAP